MKTDTSASRELSSSVWDVSKLKYIGQKGECAEWQALFIAMRREKQAFFLVATFMSDIL